ncbi:MAG: hypothetical protein KF746_09950 [Chitinophagaceae bacterium]|nr:hypothetical protein [Chitinophagaceae bacterium]
MKVLLNSIFVLLLCASAKANDAVWQWSVEVKQITSKETNDHPRAFLWVPTNCKHVRAVVLGMHNMSEEGIFEHPEFRKAMSRLGFAIIWVTPSFDIKWDPENNVNAILDTLLTNLGELSGYTELKFAPIVPIGHSAMATYPWNFGAVNPERTLAILSIHGDAPRTKLTGYGGKNLDWGNRTIEGVPGLMVMGEYEWMDDRLTSAFAYRAEHPNAPVSFLADAGHGHFDHSDELVNYLNLFLTKAAKYRLPANMPLDKPTKLIPVNADNGWLADRWHKDEQPTTKAAPYNNYTGDKSNAFWYFDKEMAKVTEKYYARVRGKKEQYIGYLQADTLLKYDPKLHARIMPAFEPLSDGLSFHVKAVYTDTLRKTISNKHAKSNIVVTRICGPVKKINDTTFSVRFYRMGFNNPRRTGDIWLLASNKGDKDYKSTVQQANIRILLSNKEGSTQEITFPIIADQPKGKKTLTLQATASSGLPVYYYVQEGPAYIKDNQIHFTKIPPRAKFPIKVIVVAWQYGMAGKIKSAIPVEQIFYITK